MLGPVLARPRDEFGVFELKLDVLEVVAERRAGQAFHVLEDEGPRPRLAHRADRLRKHVPRVVVGAMLAAEGERLARRPAGDQVQPILERREIHAPHVPLDQRPVAHHGVPKRLVLAHGDAAVVIPLHHRLRVEPRPVQPDAQAARAGEEFDRLHDSKNVLITFRSQALVAQLAFPQRERAPAERLQLPQRPLVSHPIALQLGYPELLP